MCMLAVTFKEGRVLKEPIESILRELHVDDPLGGSCVL